MSLCAYRCYTVVKFARLRIRCSREPPLSQPLTSPSRSLCRGSWSTHVVLKSLLWLQPRRRSVMTKSMERLWLVHSCSRVARNFCTGRRWWTTPGRPWSSGTNYQVLPTTVRNDQFNPVTNNTIKPGCPASLQTRHHCPSKRYRFEKEQLRIKYYNRLFFLII